jgi:hypothetical protein
VGTFDDCLPSKNLPGHFAASGRNDHVSVTFRPNFKSKTNKLTNVGVKISQFLGSILSNVKVVYSKPDNLKGFPGLRESRCGGNGFGMMQNNGGNRSVTVSSGCVIVSALEFARKLTYEDRRSGGRAEHSVEGG